MGPEPTACGICKFDSSSGFGLHPYLSLCLISPSQPTAGWQTGFLRIGLLWVSALGIGPSAAPAPGRVLAEGGRGNQGTLVVGVWVSSRRSRRPRGPEQFWEPPLVGACTLPTAALPRQAQRTLVHQPPSPRPGAAGHLLRTALSGQTPLSIPHYPCSHVLNKPMALCPTEGCPPPPMDTDALTPKPSAFAFPALEDPCALLPAERSP